jgi:hypothetical protein
MVGATGPDPEARKSGRQRALRFTAFESPSLVPRRLTPPVATVRQAWGSLNSKNASYALGP